MSNKKNKPSTEPQKPVIINLGREIQLPSDSLKPNVTKPTEKK